MTLAPARGGVVHVDAEVIATRRAGDYQHLTLVAEGVAELSHPGQFVALAVGGPTSGLLLRRSFSIHKASTTGTYGGTVDIVVADAGPGTRWITRRRVHDRLDLIGPLGRGFRLPKDPQPCVLVGGGYGSAPLSWLAELLRGRGSTTHLILGAATERRLFGVVEGRRLAGEVTVTTDDGSAGTRGRVTDVLPEVLARTGAAVIYACGPMAMLRAVTEVGARHGAVTQAAVEEAMACGVGVCMTCVLPVRGTDGLTRMARSCTDGPVFAGDQVRWDAIEDGRCHVPEDALGAPAPAAGGGRW